jgi:RHS repeat-associated protein
MKCKRLQPKRGNMVARLICLLIVLAAWPVAAQTVTYVHTDALGSVVAKTDANGNVVERYDYEPYGAPVGAGVQDGPAYTGHVSDSATGLSYMQQRYMDPQLGVFLSVDPVTAYQKPVDQFNRYRYGYGNPYKFTDPDGRQAIPMPAPYITPLPATSPGEYIQRSDDPFSDTPQSGQSGRPNSRPTVRPTGRDTVRRGRDGKPIPATPGEKVASAIDKIKGGKSPAPGVAGQRGELVGGEGEADSDWQRLKDVPGSEVKGDSNIRLPDGSNVNRHGSTRPYKDGPARGSDTIKHYPAGSSIPTTTIRYPKGE